MLLMSFFNWWYGSGWLNNVTQSRVRLAKFSKNFSVVILLGTLFSPWKQVYSTTATSQTAMNRFLDNLISRLVGFAVRSMTLFIALIGLIFISVFQFIWILVWLVLPILIPVTLLYSAGVF